MSDKNKTIENGVEENPEQIDGFPDASQITTLIGDDFEMPTITTESEESAPSAEPEPIEDPETGESYFDESGEYERPENSDENQSGERDKKGRLFNPQEHAVDSNGNPKYSKKGYFVFLRKDKRGKVDTETPKKAEYFETAKLYFEGATDCLAGLLGDHWKPENDAQRDSVSRSIARYLETENAPTLTPKQEMMLKLGAYSAPRVTHTDTIDNVKILLTKSVLGVKTFWATITGKKKPKHNKPEPAPIAEEIPNDINNNSNNQ